MEEIWLEIALVLVAVLANGFFAASEIALVSARISRLAELRERGVAGAATAMRLKEAPEAFLATIQIAITAVSTLASAVGGATAAEALTPWLSGLGLSRGAAGATALGLVILVITYLSLVLGELTPKAIALRNPERAACLVAPIVQALSRLSSGLVWLLTVSTNAVLRVLGLGRTSESPFVSEAEVRYLVREGAAKGIFEKVEEELVHNVFEFADTTVRQIMVPRPDVRGLEVDTPPDEVLRAASAIGRTRIPVYRRSLEHIVGVVSIKDILAAVARAEPPMLAALLHPPLFVPESSRVSAVLREFQRTRQSLALVVDEYGSIAGLITVEDVVEEIVGELREEREQARSTIRRLPDGAALLDGRATIQEVRDVLGLPIPDSPDYTTVGGLVIASLNAIPGPGATLNVAGRRWTVIEMAGPRVAKVRLERTP